VLDDPYHERDGAYLRRAEELARRHGALFLLDEIFTGFRFRSGSAQRHYELRPDLTCLGKALANGWPLAALVGRGDVLPRTIERLQYLATYRGEAHSFAAASEVLRLHLQEDVPARVWAAGDAIREGVDEACRRLGLPARLVGPPYRMYLAFEDGGPEQRMHWRTLLQQELARNGVISHKGYVIPSVSHEGAVVARCVDAFAAALGVVAEARARGTALPFPDVAEERAS
jgi:glutamate-1-semialdehyde 2,1-aminomutase